MASVSLSSTVDVENVQNCINPNCQLESAQKNSNSSQKII